MAIRVKVIIADGVVTDVLSDGDVDVEIVDVNKDYADYDALVKRRDEVYEDKTLQERNYKVANFIEDDE